MTLHKFFITAVCILSFVLTSLAQQATAPKPTPGGEQLPPEIKEKAVNFLRRTAKDAASLSLPENRLAFLIATADLLWEHDETAARETFKVAESDVRQMIVAQLQKAALAAAASDDLELGFLNAFETGDGSAMDVQSIINLREQLVLAIGKHDGEAAYRFLLETRQPAPAVIDKDGKPKSNSYGRGMQLPTADDYRESSLETRLARVVAQNDPQKALEIGLKRLSVGLSEDLSSFAVRLYFKDKTRGAQLAKEIARKAESANLASDFSARRIAISLLKNGANSIERGAKDKEIGKTPFLSDAELRNLANSLGRTQLAMAQGQVDRTNFDWSEIREILPLLEKYSASSAAQLEAKLTELKSVEIKESSEATDDEFKTYLEHRKKEEKALEDLQKSVESAKGEFSLQGARTALSLIKNRTAKLAAMSQIVITFADNGKIEEARELIADARKTLVPQPRFWAHYVEHLVVARALASVEPKQSLEMLENLIYQIDDMLTGVSKIAEFIAGETAVKHNELRLSGIPGMIGGSIFSQIGRGGGARDFTTGFEKDILKLAKADFDRTAALADKFTRPEIRLMARMILINSFLPQKDAENSMPETIEAEDGLPPGQMTVIASPKPSF
ncbi:MAG: hypothetical protein M3209_19300 [Acidobacteriota bacterium]|nr:hypothetical protein [Acidobacteriota bacterium]